MLRLVFLFCLPARRSCFAPPFVLALSVQPQGLQGSMLGRGVARGSMCDSLVQQAPTDPVRQSWPRGTGSVGDSVGEGGVGHVIRPTHVTSSAQRTRRRAPRARRCHERPCSAPSSAPSMPRGSFTTRCVCMCVVVVCVSVSVCSCSRVTVCEGRWPLSRCTRVNIHKYKHLLEHMLKCGSFCPSHSLFPPPPSLALARALAR